MPLNLDVGCAKGGWIITQSQLAPFKNWLGLEIRNPCVDFASQRAKAKGLKNCAFLQCNVNINIGHILSHLIENNVKIEMITFHHPDPLFKLRHKKRKVLTKEFIETLAKYLPQNARVYLQTDIKMLYDEMKLSFKQYDQFFHYDTKYNTSNSPHLVKTEREIATINKKKDIYRAMLYRT